MTAPQQFGRGRRLGAFNLVKLVAPGRGTSSRINLRLLTARRAQAAALRSEALARFHQERRRQWASVFAAWAFLALGGAASIALSFYLVTP